jgi:hypothetical protein
MVRELTQARSYGTGLLPRKSLDAFAMKPAQRSAGLSRKASQLPRTTIRGCSRVALRLVKVSAQHQQQQQATQPLRPATPGAIRATGAPPSVPPGMGTPFPPPPGYYPPAQQVNPQQLPQVQGLWGAQPPPKQALGSYASALVAAAFIAGLGVGVYFDSEVRGAMSH